MWLSYTAAAGGHTNPYATAQQKVTTNMSVTEESEVPYSSKPAQLEPHQLRGVGTEPVENIPKEQRKGKLIR